MKTIEIGDIIYGWKVLSIDGRTPDGHKILTVQCIKCGYIRRNVGRSAFKINPNCNHYSNKRKINWTSTRIRKIYQSMLIRCFKKDSKDYRFYGAKGITVCEERRLYPYAFLGWALANGYKESLTLDRIDSTKDYCPENCRWVSLQENAKMKSSTNIYRVYGIEDSGRGWARRLGLGTNAINVYARKHSKKEILKYIRSKYRASVKNQSKNDIA